jgi:hypothetical protein
MVRAIFKRKEIDRRIGLPSVAGFRDGHFSAIDAVAAAKEHHDVAVEDIALRVEGQTRIRSEISSVTFRWRQR